LLPFPHDRGDDAAIGSFRRVRYRGAFRRFFRAITLAYTPLAVIANVVLWLVS